MRFAFLLLEKPQLPRPVEVVRAHARLDPDGPALTPSQADDDQLSFEIEDHALIVQLMPAPVPDGEADEAAQFSISSFGTGWRLASHEAHLLAVLQEPEGTPAVESLVRFTKLLAALTEASGALGVYWGSAHATHAPGFFLDVARERDLLPVMLWTGVDLAHDEDRLSLLSLGLKSQLGIDDLRLTAPRGQGNAALELFFDLIAYAVRRGGAVPEGETVGRDESERLPVSVEPSPIDPEARVWRVDLPAPEEDERRGAPALRIVADEEGTSDETMIGTKEELAAVVRQAFPMEADRFALVTVEPGDPEYEAGPVERRGDGYALVLRAIVFAPPLESGKQQIESVSEQEVLLVRERALPISEDRLFSYLAAVGQRIAAQPFSRLSTEPPHTWFNGALLETESLSSTKEFLAVLE